MIELREENDGRLLAVHATGKLTSEDYAAFVPRVEGLIARHGKIRLLFEMHDFHGWTLGAFWEDVKFDLKHINHIERLAIVGEKRWQQGMSTFCKPFTTARIRYFSQDQIEQATEWLGQELTVKA